MLIELPIGWIIGLNIGVWLLIQLGLAWALTQLAPERLNPCNCFARPRRWEANGRFYERGLAVKVWKDYLPDGAAWFRGGFPKAKLRASSPEFLARFISETWRGELVHWLALLAVPVFAVWNPWWAVLVNLVYAVVANAPAIIVQRYNRARLLRVAGRRGVKDDSSDS